MKRYFRFLFYSLMISFLTISCASDDDDDDSSSSSSSATVVSGTLTGTVTDTSTVSSLTVFLDENANGALDESTETYTAVTGNSGDYSLSFGSGNDITSANIESMQVAAILNDGSSTVLASSLEFASLSFNDASSTSSIQSNSTGTNQVDLDYLSTIAAKSGSDYNSTASSLREVLCGDNTGSTIQKNCYQANMVIRAMVKSLQDVTDLDNDDYSTIYAEIGEVFQEDIGSETSSDKIISFLDNDVSDDNLLAELAERLFDLMFDNEIGTGGSNYVDVEASEEALVEYISNDLFSTVFNGLGSTVDMDSVGATLAINLFNLDSQRSQALAEFVQSLKFNMRNVTLGTHQILPPNSSDGATHISGPINDATSITLNVSMDQPIIDQVNFKPYGSAVTSFNNTNDSAIITETTSYDDISIEIKFAELTGDREVHLTVHHLTFGIHVENSRDRTPRIQIATVDEDDEETHIEIEGQKANGDEVETEIELDSVSTFLSNSSSDNPAILVEFDGDNTVITLNFDIFGSGIDDLLDLETKTYQFYVAIKTTEEAEDHDHSDDFANPFRVQHADDDDDDDEEVDRDFTGLPGKIVNGLVNVF